MPAAANTKRWWGIGSIHAPAKGDTLGSFQPTLGKNLIDALRVVKLKP